MGNVVVEYGEFEIFGYFKCKLFDVIGDWWWFIWGRKLWLVYIYFISIWWNVGLK